MLDAHCDFAGFRGKTDAELRAWLKMILTRNLLTVARRYTTSKRTTRCEVTLQEQLEKSSALLHQHLVAVAGLLRRGLKKLRENFREEA